MTPTDADHSYLIPEARFLDRLAQTRRTLDSQVEPPLTDLAAHREWDDARDEFTADCELLKEDMASLWKEWET